MTIARNYYCWPIDQVDDLKRRRYDVSDVLRDVCRILGGVECLRQAVFLLKREVRTHGLPACAVSCSCLKRGEDRGVLFVLSRPES